MWIRVVTQDEAKGKLREIYDHITETRGKIANILLVQGLNPRALKAHLDLYLAVMYGPSKLSRTQREMIATVVSARNKCDYCVAHHAEALNQLVKDRTFVERLSRDLNSVTLDGRDRKLLEFALKLTERPADMQKSDIDQLRNEGFSDSAILDGVLAISYFNLVNRIALALGVEYDASEMTGYKY